MFLHIFQWGYCGKMDKFYHKGVFRILGDAHKIITFKIETPVI